MIELGVTSTSAVSEPRTSATAAACFPRFRDDTAFGAYKTDSRRRGCWCAYVSLVKIIRTREQSLLGLRGIYLPDVSLRLTFAGLDALKPPVISISATNMSTILIPTTARSAATGSA